MKATGNIKHQEVSTKAALSCHVKNAMLLSPVIRCVLQYLSLEDIKKCRYLSKEWDSVAQPLLRTFSAIKFLTKEMDLRHDDTLFYPCKFFERFSSTLETMPFTAFKIDRNLNYPWDLRDLNEFFQRQQENIRELRIKNLYLANEDGKKMDIFDVTPWLSNSPITKINTKYRTKLEIVGDFHQCLCVRLILPSAILANVKLLSLSQCQVNLQDHIQLSPIKLLLDKIAFYKDGNKLRELCINDIVDMSRLKQIDLQNSGHHFSKFTELSMDFADNLDLEYLNLCKIKVTNWRDCRWTVNKLEMFSQPFVEKTEMQIQEIDFHHCKIDLACLPLSIEKLKITFTGPIICSGGKKVILDNLHYLALNFLENTDFSVIFQFVQCPNVIDLDFRGKYQAQLEINSDWIPKSVKKIKLRHVTLNWIEGNKDFNLDKLVLIGYSFCDVKNICSILMQTKDLVLQCPKKAEGNKNVLHFLEYLRLRNFSDCHQRIYVGPFQWTIRSFKESPLFCHVDSQAEYYLFENEKGKSLNVGWFDFEKI